MSLCPRCPFRLKPEIKIADFDGFVAATLKAPLACTRIEFASNAGQSLNHPEGFHSWEAMRECHEKLPGKGWTLSSNDVEEFPLA
jgi:hypothetical protein